MTNSASILLWFRRGDLRLSDNPALAAALETGRPIVPVFLNDEEVRRLGAAPRWQLGRSLASLTADIESRGGRLVLREGDAEKCLDALLAESGARTLYWNRRYEPLALSRDGEIKSGLQERGIEAKSFSGNLLFEPWNLRSSSGTPYRVYTAMWKAQHRQDVASPVRAPGRLPVPEEWPDSDRLEKWQLGADMRRGAKVVEKYATAGEDAAQEALEDFLEYRLAGYGKKRDEMDGDHTSGLSAFLATGDIGVRQCWHATQRALEEGASGAQPFLRQLMWREFANHLLYHMPGMESRCWRSDWDEFGWNGDENRPEIDAWKQGRTGIGLVDAAMREMMVTGTMHNRARMVVASFLTKHLLADWRIGMRWFEEHLIDWDAGNNVVGWQWVAGCGPDAAPFFRIFNPERQADRFDPDGAYQARWIAEGQAEPPRTALDYFDAVPRRWNLRPDAALPEPVIDLAEGRGRALAAFERMRNDRDAS